MSAQLDAIGTWIGLTIAGATVLGLAAAVPAAPPPDVAAAADTVDAIAASPYPATASHRLAADAAWVGPHRIGLRTDGGTAWAMLRRGPVTPAAGDGLRRVLAGTSPAVAFDSPASFRTAAKRAREAGGEWRDAGEQLTVRRVRWRGVRVTLVGA